MTRDYKKFSAGLDLKPVQKDGQPAGLQVQFLKPNNAFERLGVESGDRILSINDHPLVGPDEGPWIFEEFRKSTTFHLQVERNGQQIPLRVELTGRSGHGWRGPSGQ